MADKKKASRKQADKATDVKSETAAAERVAQTSNDSFNSTYRTVMTAEGVPIVIEERGEPGARLTPLSPADAPAPAAGAYALHSDIGLFMAARAAWTKQVCLGLLVLPREQQHCRFPRTSLSSLRPSFSPCLLRPKPVGWRQRHPRTRGPLPSTTGLSGQRPRVRRAAPHHQDQHGPARAAASSRRRIRTPGPRAQLCHPCS